MNNLNRIISFRVSNHKVIFNPAVNKGRIIDLNDQDWFVSFILIDYGKIQPISTIDNLIETKIENRLNDILTKEGDLDYFNIDFSKVTTVQDKAIVYHGYVNGFVSKIEIDIAGNIQVVTKTINDDSVWKKFSKEFFWNGFTICNKRNGLKIQTTDSFINGLNKIMPEVMLQFYKTAASIVQEDIKKGIFK